MSDEKCPYCGAPYFDSLENMTWFVCRTLVSRHQTVRTEKCKDREIVALKAENSRMRDELISVVGEALVVDGLPESARNAIGQPVSTEPSPSCIVAMAISILKGSNRKLLARLDSAEAERKKLQGLLRTAGIWLEHLPCGAVCQCQGEWDCGLKQIKRDIVEASAEAE